MVDRSGLENRRAFGPVGSNPTLSANKLRTTALSEGLDLEEAADILHALGSPETYRHLVVGRGRTGDRFEAWYGEALERLLVGSGEPA